MKDDLSAQLAQKIQNLPNLPGVYQMLDKNGAILYVGKAKSLKNRVSGYFAKNITHPKTRALVEKIADFALILVHSETEALFLEQNLIQKHRPPYNVLLREDKSYVYIGIGKGEFARLFIQRGKYDPKDGVFFGPYLSAATAKQNLLFIQKLFLLRSCSDSVFKSAKRPCLEYQIKQCKAPCVGFITAQEYQQDLQNAQLFLQGNNETIKALLVQKMQDAAEAMRFEEAAAYRDRLTELNALYTDQAAYTQKGDVDIMACQIRHGLVGVHVLVVRGGRILGGKNYFVEDIAIREDAGESLAQFVLSFYRDMVSEVPSEIITHPAIPDAPAVAALLDTHKKITISHRVKTHKKQWQDIAILNIQNALQEKLVDQQQLQARFLALQEILAPIWNKTIMRIECFDISHTQGEAAVGSCVVFDRQGAKRREYRQYNIKDGVGGDDYAAMRQVLYRRYRKNPLPDLLLIDGGKGQLAIAKEVMQQLDKAGDTLLVGIAKGEGRKAGLEVLHFVAHAPLDLPSDHKALHLLMYVRDEAHRFAIGAHRKKRDRRRSSSILQAIPGLGQVRRLALLTHFGGMQQLLAASEHEIAQVPGIGKTLAGVIYAVLHQAL